ncbi:hypothetical protein AHF37_02386 [Paragonimus kellicotti]|nr:hypothetical protein AHF37_02386 [Paragonimus kellicotti]
METWKTTEESNESEASEPCLWPAEFARCMTDFERVSVLMRHSSIRQFTLLPGELVLIERPVVRRLYPNRLEMNCYQCFRRSYNLYPCRVCSEVGFCSRACEQVAWETPAYTSNNERNGLCHRFECGQVARFPKLDLAGWSWLEKQNTAVLERYQALVFKSPRLTERIYGTDVCWLAFASIAQTEPQKLRSLAQGISIKDGMDQTDGTIPERSQSSLSAFSGVYEPPSADLCDADCLSVGWLPNRRKMLEGTDLTGMITVCSIHVETYCLLTNNLFRHPGLPACMLQQLLALSYASQDVTCTTYVNRNSEASSISEVIWDRIQVDKLGKALYPITGLRTVSCDPSTHAVHMADGVCALFTLKHIRCGEMLSRTRSGQFVEYNRMESQK